MRRFCLVAAALAFAVPVMAGEPRPQDVRAMLETMPASEVVAALNAGDPAQNDWAYIMTRIEGGEPAWLDLVPLLKPGADAGAAEDLRITLSRTLAFNAPGALALIANGVYPPAEICTSNEIEVAPLDAIVGIDAALKSVAAVLDAPLREVRDACLSELAETRIDLLVGAAKVSGD